MIMNSIQKRRSIRKYTDEKLSADQIHSLLLAAMYAPSAWGKKSWEFVVIDDENLRKEIGNITPYASQAVTAPVAIVVMSDKNVSNSWVEDASIAAEHINLEAAKLGLGSSWIQIRGMKHNTLDAEEYLRKTLSIPDHYGICCLITVGYPAEQKSVHREVEFTEEKVHFNKFGEHEMAA